jgi:hypothetical protein
MKYVAVVIITTIVVLAGAFVFFKRSSTLPAVNPNQVSTESAVPTGMPSPTPESENDMIIAAVRAGLVAEHGAGAAGMTITISKIEGDYSQGMANDTGGGGLWFAAKTENDWKLVWDGNGIINCTDINAYPGFPRDIIPQCFDKATGKMVDR